MIKSFGDKRTVAVFREVPVKGVGDQVARPAKRKLDLLHAVVRVEELLTPPGNRLEKLRGDREGQWSIRVNDQWRLCFRWDGRDAHDVELVDYH